MRVLFIVVFIIVFLYVVYKLGSEYLNTTPTSPAPSSQTVPTVGQDIPKYELSPQTAPTKSVSEDLSKYELSAQIIADDLLTVRHNGKVVHKTPGSWRETLRFVIPNVRPSDIIEFEVLNINGTGGFIGKWTWNNRQYFVNRETFPDSSLMPMTYQGHIDMAQTMSGAEWLWQGDMCQNCTRIFKWTAV